MKLKHLVIPVLAAIAIMSVALTSYVDADAASWNTKIVVDSSKVGSYLNIRKSASTSSQVVGQLKVGSSADILQIGKEWTLIQAGNVRGYVKTQYCLYGSAANKASGSTTTAASTSVSGKKAVSTVNCLKIRSGASTSSKVVGMVGYGQSMTVTGAVNNSWVAVKCNGVSGYVASQYISYSSTGSSSTQSASTAVSTQSDSQSQQMAQIKAYNQAIKSGKSEKEARAYALAAAKTSSTQTDTSSSSTSTSSTSVSSDTLTLLAGIIMCEAGGEPYEGQVAVGAVVMNRVKSSKFPNSISGVIYQKGQFTPAGTGKLDRVIASGNITQSCYTAAQAALAGQDNTGGCLYFHVGSNGKLNIGHHTFN